MTSPISVEDGRAPDEAPEPQPKNGFDKFFEITKRGSTTGREIRGGLVTFVTMAYIVILNPIILSGTKDVDGNMLNFAQVGAATSLTAGVMTVLIGLFARVPFGIAAGLGINSFLAVSVVGQVTWPEAMGLVMINGIIIVILGATNVRTAIFMAAPQSLKAAITVGIGLFIAFIGFVDSGFVTRTPAGPPVQLGAAGSLTTIPSIIFVIAVLLIGILVSFGLLLTLTGLVPAFWGKSALAQPAPEVIGGKVEFLGIVLSQYTVFLIACGAVIVVGMWLLLTKTSFGKTVVAVATDRQMASALGVRVSNVSMLVFAIAGGLAGIGGALVAPLASIDVNIGMSYLLFAFVAMTIGGLGSIPGTFVGAMIIGVVDSLFVNYLPEMQPFAAYLAAIVVLIFWPRGIFPGAATRAA